MEISDGGRTITMRAPDDWHVHFRQGHLLNFLVPLYIEHGWRRRMVAEPNLIPANTTGELALRHRAEILSIAKPHAENFEPIATMQITEDTTKETVIRALSLGIRVFKVYPRWVTTNSENGVENYIQIYKSLEPIHDFICENPNLQPKIVVQFHSEHPSFDIEGEHKEPEFLDRILEPMLQVFPKLRISVEHIKTSYGVEWVKDHQDNVGASVTVQHLTNTIDDLIGYSKRSGGFIRPHEGFKPQAGSRSDRDALRLTVIRERHPRFWYGGDPAWHFQKKKECACGACGAANTLAAIPLLIDLFMEHGKIENLESFLSEYGANFYGYPLNEETITAVRSPWKVDNFFFVSKVEDDVVVPWRAGEMMNWEIR